MLERGANNDTVRAVQELLAFLGYRGKRQRGNVTELVTIVPDGDFGALTESAVLAFQGEHGLLMDGRVGDTTMEVLRKAYATRQQEIVVPGPIAALTPATGLLPFEKCEADPWGGGYASGWLRADAAEAYRKLRAEGRRQGALITSSGMRRDLNASVGPNRSATSMHYTGRALDLYIYGGMQKPAEDPHLVERLGDRRYRVWARCTADVASSPGDLPPEITVQNIVTSAQRIKGVSVTGRFLDLTALFGKFGFRPIRARPAFETGGDYLGAEWWHFQWEEGLVPGVATFGSDLLRAFPRATVEGTPPWNFRDRVWQVGWF